jgi:hypothetical protein
MAPIAGSLPSVDPSPRWPNSPVLREGRGTLAGLSKRAVAPTLSCPYFADMPTAREEAVRRALELIPGSIRALAEEAGLSEGLLRKIRDGERRATQTTVEALADALSRWASRNSEAARILRETLSREKDR